MHIREGVSQLTLTILFAIELKIFSNSARSHWLRRGHTTPNNVTVSAKIAESATL